VRTYVIFFENVMRPTREVIAAHVAHLRALDDAGALVVCGPFADGDGGMVCVQAETIDRATAMAAGDPFVEQGFKRFRVRELERATRDNGYLG
jgi:uncharacterized protein YciI